MLKRVGFCLLACLLLLSPAALAQSDAGKVKGTVTDETGAPVEFATVVVIEDGVIKGGANTDAKGEYIISPVSPGTYEVKASFAGNSASAPNITVIANRTKLVKLVIKTGVELNTVEIRETIPIDQTTVGGTLTKQQIQQTGIRNINTLAAIIPGVFQSDDGGSLNVRGGRSNATTYFVDGVKVRGVTGLPQKAISQLTVITGGTPAEFGDMIGGIVSVTTSSPSYQLSGGGEILTSQFLDNFGYNLVALNASGPIFTRYIDSIDYKQPVLGFFIAAEGEFQTDRDPSAIDIPVLNDNTLNDFRQTPLQLDQTGNFFIQRANFITEDQVDFVQQKPNNRDDRIRVNARFDFQPTNNVIIKFGVTAEDINQQAFSLGNSLMAPEANQRFEGTMVRSWARFQQSFPGGRESQFKNLFYMIQADYTYYTREFLNDVHRRDLFNYGHIGNFTFDREEIYRYVDPTADNHNGSVSSDGYFITAGFSPNNLQFDDSQSKNPLMANYNNVIFDFVGQNGIINPFTGQREYNVRNLDFLAFYGGLRNGDSPRSIYSLFSGTGANQGSYFKFRYDQFRLTGQLSGEFRGHNIKAGFEFEQRVERRYAVASRFLWNYIRQLTNRHLAQINPDPQSWELVQVDGVFQDTVNAPILYSSQDQSDFDRNLRIKLGLPADGTDFIITDNLDPSFLSLDMFSPDELLNDGAYLVSYYGYDWKGDVQSRVADEDFFSNTDVRPLNAFSPTYISGFIQDKFELEDIIFNVGVRIDRFDANQKVLKDEYVLLPTYTAAEAATLIGAELPEGVANDWVPYMDDARNPTTFVGFRDPSDDLWYDATGTPASSAALRVGGEVQPYLKDDEVTIESFEDYQPQTIVMPRLSFSFPISGNAVFFAHYDVLAQRPGQNGNAASSLLAGRISDWVYLQNNATISVTNSNLRPERTIDYEVGFKQALTPYLALSISAFYREMRDMIQTQTFQDAYPTSYTSFNNIDFGTVKGFTFSLNMLRTKNVRMTAAYTLQFANGTGSSFTSSRNALNSVEGFTAIRTLLPLDFDQRHRISGNFDYRFFGNDNKGPMIKLGEKEIYPLANAGLNVTFTLGSGTPYSVNSLANNADVQGGVNQNIQLAGSPNGSRKPSQVRFDLRLDKSFILGGKARTDEAGAVIKDGLGQPILGRRYDFNVYILLLNALNTQNVINVYRTSGLPDDDGYLSTQVGQQQVAASIDPDSFTYLYTLRMQNPNNFSLPRRVRLGVQFSF